MDHRLTSKTDDKNPSVFSTSCKSGTNCLYNFYLNKRSVLVHENKKEILDGGVRKTSDEAARKASKPPHSTSIPIKK